MLGASASFGFVFVVAVANLLAGYATAAYLARRVRRKTAPPVTTPPPAMPSEAAKQPEVTLQPPLPEQADPVDEAPTTEAEEWPAEEETHEQSDVQLALKWIIQDMGRLEDELVEADSRVRESTSAQTSDILKAYAADFDVLVQDQLEQLNETTQHLNRFAAEAPEVAAEYERVHGALGTVSFHLSSRLARPAAAGDPEGESREQLLSGLGRVLNACYEVRCRLEKPILEILRAEELVEDFAADMAQETDGRMGGRMRLEAALREWRNRKPHAAQPLAMGVVDVDQLREVNEKYSPMTGNRILDSVEQITCRLAGEDTIVATLAGRQVTMVMNDSSPGDAAEVVERIRQSVEKTLFQQGDDEIRVTVSAAAVAGREDDTNDQLVERLCSTLQEAKSYGCNRTFLCVDDCPSPVVPPSEAIEERLIMI